jgi:hypothetical protein
MKKAMSSAIVPLMVTGSVTSKPLKVGSDDGRKTTLLTGGARKMTDREKLIELLESLCVDYGATAIFFTNGEAEVIADHLIANGVTVRERGRWKTTEVTEEWETAERFHHFHRECKYSYCDNGLGGHYFCPNCGADMRQMEEANV